MGEKDFTEAWSVMWSTETQQEGEGFKMPWAGHQRGGRPKQDSFLVTIEET